MTPIARHLRTLVWIGVLAQLVLGFPRPSTQAQVSVAGTKAGPKQVLLIRHAEKPGDPSTEDDAKDPDLSTKGYERAGALAPYLPATFPTPDFLFATKGTSKSNRPVETITPLATALQLKIDKSYAESEYGMLATEVTTNPKYAGKRVLICWHHGTIADLAHALGVDPQPEKWKGHVFDQVWQVDYSGGKATMTKIPQRLLYGDSAN